MLHDDEDDLEDNEQLPYLNRITQRSKTIPKYTTMTIISNLVNTLNYSTISSIDIVHSHLPLKYPLVTTTIPKISTSNNNRVKFSLI